MTLNSILSILIVLFAILIGFGFVKYALREKYADSVLQQRSNERENVFRSAQRSFKYLRIFLWLFPLYVIVLPLLLYTYSEVNLWVGIISMLLVVVGAYQEYVFKKWLLSYFERTMSQQPEITK